MPLPIECKLHDSKQQCLCGSPFYSHSWHIILYRIGIQYLLNEWAEISKDIWTRDNKNWSITFKSIIALSYTTKIVLYMNVRIYPDDIYTCRRSLLEYSRTINSHCLWEKDLRTWGPRIYFHYKPFCTFFPIHKSNQPQWYKTAVFFFLICM